MEKTLIIIKPDAMERRLAGEVLGRFERAGFELAACKMMRLSPELLREHYAHLVALPFYPRIEAFMLSRPVVVAVLRGPGVIARAREMLGPTDPRKAPPGTIRGDLASDTTANVAHASDSPQSAEAEMRRFFSPDEIFV